MQSSSKRNWIFAVSVFVLIVAALVAQARVERNYRATAAQHINIVVDSIDFRSDLTRVYGRLIGRPHTSQRIDKIELLDSNNQYESLDIDGVDFKRWFQWEEDGVIPVEIDFDHMPAIKNGVLLITTPRGVDRIGIKK